MSMLVLLLISLSIQPRIIYGVDPIRFSCSKVKANPEFDKSKAKIFHDLQNAFPPTPFSMVMSTLGQNVPNAAYGLAQCGNIVHADCKKCVVEAVNEVQRRCPSDTEAKIWYDNCFFRYSNQIFFGKVNHQDDVYIPTGPIANDTSRFNERIHYLVTTMANNTIKEPISNMFTHDALFYDKRVIYGMALCTMDLSAKACLDCLNHIANRLPLLTGGRENARVLGTSCMLRYEFNNFLNT